MCHATALSRRKYGYSSDSVRSDETLPQGEETAEEMRVAKRRENKFENGESLATHWTQKIIKREPVNRYKEASQENMLLKMYSKHQKAKEYAQDECKRERESMRV